MGIFNFFRKGTGPENKKLKKSSEYEHPAVQKMVEWIEHPMIISESNGGL